MLGSTIPGILRIARSSSRAPGGPSPAGRRRGAPTPARQRPSRGAARAPALAIALIGLLGLASPAGADLTMGTADEPWSRRPNWVVHGSAPRPEFVERTFGIAAAGGRVVTAHVVEDEPAEVVVHAADVRTGQTIWTATIASAGAEQFFGSIGAAPDDRHVFVASWAYDAQSPDRLGGTLRAFAAATGALSWIARDLTFHVTAITTSSDGRTIYGGGTRDGDYAIAAFDAATGAGIWVATYDGPAALTDRVSDISVAPDGQTVYVTGSTQSPGPTWHPYTPFWYSEATIALDAATGKTRWSRLWTSSNTQGMAVRVGPDASRVYVLSRNYPSYGQTRSGGGFEPRFRVAAYDSATGADLWAAAGAGFGRAWGWHGDMVVSADGTSVFATAGQETVSFDAADGRRRWSAIGGSGLALSPEHSSVYVGGIVRSITQSTHLTITALDQATGRTMWAGRTAAPPFASVAAMLVDDDRLTAAASRNDLEASRWTVAQYAGARCDPGGREAVGLSAGPYGLGVSGWEAVHEADCTAGAVRALIPVAGSGS